MYDKNGSKLFQYLATLTGSFAVITSGVNQGWTSPYIPKLMSNSSAIPITSEQGSWCAIASLLGCPIGGVLACLLSDRIGRKWTTLIIAPVVFISFLIIAIANSIWTIIVCRLAIAAAEGVYYITLPMYIGEISDPKIRGFLSASLAIATIIGVLFINVIGSIFDIYTSSIISASLPLVHFMTYCFMPESPYFYIKKGKIDNARKSLQKLRGVKDVEEELESLSKFVAKQEQSSPGSYLDIFRVKSNLRAVFYYWMLSLTNKFSGKNPCMFYTTTIFQEAGSTIDSTISVIIYCAVELVSIGLTSFLIVDRFGKRPIMITSSIGCSFAIFALATHFLLKDILPDITDHLNWLPLAALVCYNILFSIGLSFGPIAVLTELFPTNIKAKALFLADINSGILSTIAAKYFQVTFDYFGVMYVPFYTFACCSFVGFLFIYWYLPETKGQSLEQIQDSLVENKSSVIKN